MSDDLPDGRDGDEPAPPPDDEAAPPEGDQPAPSPGDEPAPPPAGEPETPGGRRFRRGVLVGVLVVLLAGGTAFGLSTRGGGCPSGDAVVQVGDRRISRPRFFRRLELLSALYGVERPADPSSEQAQAFPGDVAKSLTVALIIESRVGDRGIQAADRAVRDALDRFIADRYPEGGRAKFVEELGAKGVSEADVLGEFRRLLQTRRLFESVTADVAVSDEATAAAFQERKDQLAVPESRQLRHLVVATEAEAKAAADRIRAGEPFAAVAKSVSLDNSTKEGGGDLGLLRPNQLAGSFSKAAFAATPGVPFGPVQTDLGWHLGLVEEIVPGRPVTLDEVRQPLKEQLVAEARLKEWRAYLGREIKAADACYAKGFRPADPDAPPPDISPEVVPRR